MDTKPTRRVSDEEWNRHFELEQKDKNGEHLSPEDAELLAAMRKECAIADQLELEHQRKCLEPILENHRKFFAAIDNMLDVLAKGNPEIEQELAEWRKTRPSLDFKNGISDTKV